VNIIADKKGEDVLLLDIQGLASFADYFVICSGTSDRQLQALMKGVREGVKEALGVPPLHVEGESSSGWVLLDYGTVVVHIFTPALRAFYDLEGLWREGRVVVRVQ